MSLLRRMPTDVLALSVVLGLGCAYYSWKPIIEQVERDQNEQKQLRREIDHEALDKKIKERQAQMQAAQAYEEMLRARTAANNDSDTRS